MLWADGVSDAGGWVGFGAGLVSILSAIVSGYFAYASQRDKLRYDQTMTKLVVENERLKASEAECRAEQRSMEERVVKLETKLDGERDRAIEERRRLEASIQRERDLKHELNGRIQTMQDQLRTQGIALDLKPIRADGSGTMPAPPKPPPPPDHPF